MGILDDFIEFWVGNNRPSKSVGASKVSKGNKVKYGVVPSSDNEKIENILNSIIEKICKIDRDSNGISNLSYFLNDIVNREKQIYPLIMDVCNWQFEMNVIDNMVIHHFKLVSIDKRYIDIDVKVNKDEDILEFNAIYRGDISEYLVNKRDSCLGTIFIKISSLDGVNYSLEDKIYGLDLLNNSYNDDVIANDFLSGYQDNAGVKRVKK